MADITTPHLKQTIRPNSSPCLNSTTTLPNNGFWSARHLPTIETARKTASHRRQVQRRCGSWHPHAPPQPGDDLVTALVEAGEEGDQLSEDELVAMIVLLIIAGHETTVNLIASGTLSLLENPDQQRHLVDDKAIMDTVIDELLRFTAPVETATERYATQNIELGGNVIRRADLVLAVIASANRDERVFATPDQFDMTREPNPHVAFDDGIHYCLGHQLARLEAEIAFTCLFERSPDLQLATPANELQWRETPMVRGLTALPVRF